MMGWQLHQLDHMQIICTSRQTDDHASTLSLILAWAPQRYIDIYCSLDHHVTLTRIRAAAVCMADSGQSTMDRTPKREHH